MSPLPLPPGDWDYKSKMFTWDCEIKNSKVLKKKKRVTPETSGSVLEAELSALQAAVGVDPSSLPSTHAAPHDQLQLHCLFWSPFLASAGGVHMVQTHTEKTLIYRK